jgi:hypothetical protein
LCKSQRHFIPVGSKFGFPAILALTYAAGWVMRLVAALWGGGVLG